MYEAAITSGDSFTLEDLKRLTDSDMLRVNQVITDNLASEVVQHIILSGGKRLRPTLVILAARACRYQGETDALLAAVVEFIHTATLLHDDVVDDSDMRRGQKTASTIWGNDAAVLVGDYLYSRAFQMMVRAQSMAIMDLLANTTNTIAQGEMRRSFTPRQHACSKPRRESARCWARRARQPKTRCGITAGISGSRFNLSTMCSTTPPTATRSARMSVTISPRASRRCP
jgi:octaprenyl-diphosphate synthase